MDNSVPRRKGRQRITGRLVEVVNNVRTPIFETKYLSDGSLAMAITGFAYAKRGSRGLCVGYDNGMLSVLIDGHCMQIKRLNVCLLDES